MDVAIGMGAAGDTAVATGAAEGMPAQEAVGVVMQGKA